MALISGVSASWGQSAQLEINTATQAQLESLPGIGPALAERILAARKTALFADWDDLRHRVKGIGPATARKLSDSGLRVQGQPAK
ncbi:MAG TPA: helix-hairpin-helix domain-containing protein [Burkholderiaceae bacterium]